MWDSDPAQGLNYSLQWFDTKFSWSVSMRDCYLSTDSVRKSFELNAYKGGRQKLDHYGRTIYHWDRDGDDRLVFQDVSSWCIAGGIPGEPPGWPLDGEI